MPRYPVKALKRSSADVGGVAAVDRALTLLEAFTPSDTALTLEALATRTGLVKSTALRMLASLQHFQFVQRLRDGRYVLGGGIARLHAVYSASFSLENEVLPVLQELTRKTNETAVFYVRHGDQRLALCRVESEEPVQTRVKVGDLVPIDRGSAGRVLAAFSGAKGRMYDEVREAKVAALKGDRVPDLSGIASPVFRADGALAGALTLTMPTHRYKKSYVALVKEAARALSARLGATH